VVFKRLGSCTKRTIVYISLGMWLIFFSFFFFYYLSSLLCLILDYFSSALFPFFLVLTAVNLW
jgi:hypothetical protein